MDVAFDHLLGCLRKMLSVRIAVVTLFLVVGLTAAGDDTDDQLRQLRSELEAVLANAVAREAANQERVATFQASYMLKTTPRQKKRARTALNKAKESYEQQKRDEDKTIASLEDQIALLEKRLEDGGDSGYNLQRLFPDEDASQKGASDGDELDDGELSETNSDASQKGASDGDELDHGELSENNSESGLTDDMEPERQVTSDDAEDVAISRLDSEQNDNDDLILEPVDAVVEAEPVNIISHVTANNRLADGSLPRVGSVEILPFAEKNGDEGSAVLRDGSSTPSPDGIPTTASLFGDHGPGSAYDMISNLLDALRDVMQEQEREVGVGSEGEQADNESSSSVSESESSITSLSTPDDPEDENSAYGPGLWKEFVQNRQLDDLKRQLEELTLTMRLVERMFAHERRDLIALQSSVYAELLRQERALLTMIANAEESLPVSDGVEADDNAAAA